MRNDLELSISKSDCHFFVTKSQCDNNTSYGRLFNPKLLRLSICHCQTSLKMPIDTLLCVAIRRVILNK